MADFIQQHRLDAMRILGQCIGAGRQPCIDVFNPFSGERIASVPKATLDEVRQAYDWAQAYRPRLSRYERAGILNRCAALARERVDEIARLITAESGLSINDAVYEAGRVSDVLLFGAQEVLKDDGQIFSCDLTHHGKQRRVYTQRSPLLGVITAITPFNHPMNQVAHKVIPSVATNNRMVLKPSEKVPFSAIYLTQLLYEAGLPEPMLQVITGDPREIADEMLTHPHVDLITFTGGVAIGKYIAAKAAHRARARWQRPVDRDGRRRFARGLEPGGAGLLQELGPALHRGQTHAGARKSRGRVHRTGRVQDQGLDLWRPNGSRQPDGNRHRRGRRPPV
jgi:acyl-CoA reductase-like NAD-dependent aldehyde dehydrogenase